MFSKKGGTMKFAQMAAAALAVLAVAVTADATPVLEKVILVERHGVRPPTKSAAVLAQYSQHPWPEWPVEPGILTPHGAKALVVMGKALKQHYTDAGLFGAEACPKGVFVWADSADERTQSSGDAILKGMGCTRPSEHLLSLATDPLFDPADYGLCRPDAKTGLAAAQKRLEEVLAANRETYEKGRKALQNVLTPDGCGAKGQRDCEVGEGDNEISIDLGEVSFDGPLGTGSSLSENLLLEYAGGLPLADVGWGKGAAAMNDVLALHNLYADVMRRTPELAGTRASLMAQQIDDFLSGRKSKFKGAAPIPAGAKFVLLQGHDGNLSAMSGILETPWRLPEEPDATAPDTALAFELWRDGKQRFVRIALYYQSLEELRALTPIKTPRTVPLALPGCTDGKCPLPVVSAQLQKHLNKGCLKP